MMRSCLTDSKPATMTRSRRENRHAEIYSCNYRSKAHSTD